MACTIFFLLLFVVVALFLPATESCPMDEWMWCLALLPWHSQARTVPWLSGWGVSVTPKALSGESCPTDERMWCSALFPWHSQARAVVLRYSHCTLQRELWLFCYCCPSPFPLGSHLMVWPLSPAGFSVCLFVGLIFLLFTGIYPFSTVIQCDWCRDSHCVGSHGWFIGIASHGLIASVLVGTQPPYAMQLLTFAILWWFVFTESLAKHYSRGMSYWKKDRFPQTNQ